MSEKKLLLLGTGGTIAGKAAQPQEAVSYVAGEITAQELVASLPLDAVMNGLSLQVEQVAQVDSKDMSWAVWRSLLARCQSAMLDPQVAAIVITHGTDPLEETACLLAMALQVGKPVVLTCAMRPATALQADGPQNLLDAFCVAANGGRPGVWLVAAGKILSAQGLMKLHPYRLDAFGVCEQGASGYVQEQQVRWCTGSQDGGPWPLLREAASAQQLALPEIKLQALVQLSALPWVEVLQSAALADGRAVTALVVAGVRGIVLAGTGNATVHQELQTALAHARLQGVWVWRCTRCPEGLPVLGRPLAVKHLPVLHAATDVVVSLPPSTARVALMLCLASLGAG